jgi:energy-coupling factor transport system permease protein
MQDPRIRLVTTIMLSIAAWISVPGAILSILWWLVCGRARTSIKTLRSLFLILVIPAVMGLAAVWSGGDGLSYFIRISAVLIIASWMYAERYPGELLDVGVWFLGTKTGFDLGLIGELSMSSLDTMAREVNRISIALRQKGTPFSPGIIPAVFSGILIRQLNLAHERAILLTLRGYTTGGTHCPSFTSTFADWLNGTFSCTIFLYSLITGDFFNISGSTFII